ncbi:hypothetical protein A2U01_0046008 [Trifolium medium]|uniref:Uncharacterized protein n=1 Tax=Trifolium medium TaxID=97028 RepID=A0A392QLU4_9FABA|nr:hypothetical protein [Trifolium medium]
MVMKELPVTIDECSRRMQEGSRMQSPYTCPAGPSSNDAPIPIIIVDQIQRLTSKAIKRR